MADWKSGTSQFERALRQALRGSVRFYETSGDINMYQMKPDVRTGGTTGMTALELSPRFADGAAGSSLIGLKISCDLKGTSAGNLSSDVRGIEAKVESASGSTRVVAGVVCGINFMNAMHGTCTQGVYPIVVGSAGGNLAWTSFALVPNDSAIASSGTVSAATLNDGWLAISVGTKASHSTRYIGLSSDKPT